jgi:hypothetical protein
MEPYEMHALTHSSCMIGTATRERGAPRRAPIASGYFTPVPHGKHFFSTLGGLPTEWWIKCDDVKQEI